MNRSTVLVVKGERKTREPVRGYVEREGLGMLTAESSTPVLALAQRICEGAVA